MYAFLTHGHIERPQKYAHIFYDVNINVSPNQKRWLPRGIFYQENRLGSYLERYSDIHMYRAIVPPLEVWIVEGLSVRAIFFFIAWSSVTVGIHVNRSYTGLMTTTARPSTRGLRPVPALSESRGSFHAPVPSVVLGAWKWTFTSKVNLRSSRFTNLLIWGVAKPQIILKITTPKFESQPKSVEGPNHT